MPRRGLARQIAVAFALVAVMTALIAAAILGGLWQRLFESYVHAGLQSRAEAISSALSVSYLENGGWSAASFGDLAHLGMMEGLRVQVLDAQDNVLVDNLDFMGQMQGSGQPVTELRGPIGVAAVTVSGTRVGLVRVASSSGILLTERDRNFRQVSLFGLLAAALVAVALATAAGLLYARVVVKPIERVTATAAALRAGDRTSRTGMIGNDEVNLLGKTLDEMAEAIEADRAFERRLTADVAHELRTPLQAIQATVEAMQDGVMSADSQTLGVVRDETVRLSRLADSLLDLSRVERGEARFRSDPLDLSVPVLAAVDSHRAFVESSGLTLTQDVAAGLPILGDEDRLRQAVGNLLSNAARYTPEGGTVSVTLRPEGAMALLAVADTGIGIPEQDREKVFRRFWRADEARERSRGGAGIGLALFKEIVERHGGTVGLAPVTPSGTMFWAHLPLRNV